MKEVTVKYIKKIKKKSLEDTKVRRKSKEIEQQIYNNLVCISYNFWVKTICKAYEWYQEPVKTIFWVREYDDI